MLNEKELFDNLARAIGSTYGACAYIAKLSRQKRIELNNLISESEAITWAITKKLPDNYKDRVKARSASLKHIEDILNYVEDEEVQNAARQSFRDSIQCEHLVYDYLKVKDASKQSRVRILTRMMFYKFKEDNHNA